MQRVEQVGASAMQAAAAVAARTASMKGESRRMEGINSPLTPEMTSIWAIVVQSKYCAAMFA